MTRRGRTRAALLAALVVGTLGGTASGAGAQSCTGQLVRETARASVPFGSSVVAPTAQAVGNFGQVVIVPEATAPHDACP